MKNSVEKLVRKIDFNIISYFCSQNFNFFMQFITTNLFLLEPPTPGRRFVGSAEQWLMLPDKGAQGACVDRARNLEQTGAVDGQLAVRADDLDGGRQVVEQLAQLRAETAGRRVEPMEK